MFVGKAGQDGSGLFAAVGHETCVEIGMRIVRCRHFVRPRSQEKGPTRMYRCSV